MLIWTTVGRTDERSSFGLIVHHTDADREFAYDRQHVLSGQLDTALDQAETYGWLLADMKNDWKTVFPGSRANSASTLTRQTFMKKRLTALSPGKLK